MSGAMPTIKELVYWEWASPQPTMICSTLMSGFWAWNSAMASSMIFCAWGIVDICCMVITVWPNAVAGISSDSASTSTSFDTFFMKPLPFLFFPHTCSVRFRSALFGPRSPPLQTDKLFPNPPVFTDDDQAPAIMGGHRGLKAVGRRVHPGRNGPIELAF